MRVPVNKAEAVRYSTLAHNLLLCGSIAESELEPELEPEPELELEPEPAPVLELELELEPEQAPKMDGVHPNGFELLVGDGWLRGR